MVVDNRRLARASVVVHGEISGDPIVTDPGMSWLDILQDSWKTGSFQFDSRGRPLLEFLEGIGLTCRAFLIPQDTRLGGFDLFGGAWEEERPGTSAPRRYTLNQYDTNPGVVYAATTKATLPANPHFAVSLALEDTPADWDADTYPPFVRIELGSSWGVHFEKGAGYLVQWDAGSSQWQAVKELPAPPKGSGIDDLERFWVYVRCQRGKLGVSVDQGETYTWTDSAATIPTGKLTLRGQGGFVQFGLHQLRYYAGWFRTATRPALRIRASSAALTFEGEFLKPSGTAIAWTDRSTPASGLAAYQVDLTPAATATALFTFYSPPELYSTTAEYPVTTLPQVVATSTPWDDTLVQVVIDRPVQLDEATCTIQVELSAFTSWTGRLRDRKIEVYLGHTLEGGGEERIRRFTGYITRYKLAWSVFGTIVLEITAENAASIFKRPWGRTRTRSLGGKTLNGAGDWILNTEGLNSGYRLWHAFGDSITLPKGKAEDPADLLQPQELRWSTLTGLFSRYGLEVAVTDAGGFESLPRYQGGPYVSLVSWDKRFVPLDSSGLRDLVKTAARTVEYGELATAIEVAGTLEDGSLCLRGAEDQGAVDPLLAAATGRFTGRRRVYCEEISGTTDAAAVTARVVALANELFPLREDVDLVQPVDLRMARRDRIVLYDAAPIGEVDGTQYVIWTLRDEYRANEGLSELETTAGLKKRNVL